MSALVQADHICVRLGGQEVLHDVSLTIAPGEIVTILGPNGSGKSTLLRALLGLVPVSHGRVRRSPGLRLGYMPQKLQIDRSMPMTAARFLSLPTRHSAEATSAMLARVGVPEVAHRPLTGLSGGQMQRVLLARALLREPELLVLDEPVQGVDVAGQAELYRLITELRDRHGCGVLMVSHDLHLVMSTTDQVVCLNRHVCCSGHPEQVSGDPAFVELFGQDAQSLAIYHHHHDHSHDLHGAVISPAGLTIHGPAHVHGPNCKH